VLKVTEVIARAGWHTLSATETEAAHPCVLCKGGYHGTKHMGVEYSPNLAIPAVEVSHPLKIAKGGAPRHSLVWC
jgi:hypothetical protein